jgi:hypothetical protein
MYTIIIPIIILLGLVLTSTIFSAGTEDRKMTEIRKENFQRN